MQGFSDWLKHHCTVFSIYDPERIETVASWQPLFDAAGYTAAELTTATDWLAMNASPKYPSDHLGAIRSRLTDQRALDYRRAEDAYPSQCVLCGGTGRLVVPHLAGVRDGQWLPLRLTRIRATYYTCAVRCSCARGRFGKFDGQRGGVTLLSIEEYERRNPGWRKQLVRREQEQRAQADLAPVDSAWQKTVQGIMDRYGIRQPGEDEE